MNPIRVPRWAMPLLLLVSSVPATVARGEQAPVVSRICREVRDFKPVGGESYSPFMAKGGKVAAWSWFQDADAPDTQHIHHVWFFNDKQHADVRMRASGAYKRVFSIKRIPPGFSGAGKVEVREDNGALRQVLHFEITPVGKEIQVQPVNDPAGTSAPEPEAAPSPSPAVMPSVTPSVTPSPEPAPSPSESLAPAEAPKRDESRPAAYYVGAATDFKFFRVDSVERTTGREAILLSNLTPSLRLSFGQQWTERFSAGLFVSGEAFNIQPNGASAAIVTEGDKLHGRVGLEARYRAASRLDLSGGFSYGQEVHYQSLAGLIGVTIVSVSTPKAEARASYRVYERGSQHVSLSGGLSYLLGSSASGFTTDPGLGFGLGAESVHELDSRLSFGYGLFYWRQKQDTSLVEATRKDLGVGIGLRWRLGGEKR